MIVRVFPMLALAAGGMVVFAGVALGAPAPGRAIPSDTVQATIARLIATHGEAQAERVRRGVTQVAERWWSEDGDPSVFASFCDSSFLTDPAALASVESRLERVLEQVDGHLHEVRRELLTPLDLDTGPVPTVDRLLADLDLSVHTNEDLFKTKVAFLALLNFPVHTLAERLAQGGGWTRDAWARSRMMDRFADRIPARVLQGITTSQTAADAYIAEYNIRMDRLVTRDGKRLFPQGLRLISHWGLRDELASHYGETDALAKQRTIQRVMERIVRQEIPAAVIDNPDLDWCPETNDVRPAPGATVLAGANLSAREPDRRYAAWLANFQATRAADPYTPTAPTAIARAFDQQREIPEHEVEALLVSVLTSSELSDVAALVRSRLGRPLEPFDIWYSGFKPRAAYPEEKLDAIVRARYPTVAAFQADLPRILAGLGFSAERAQVARRPHRRGPLARLRACHGRGAAGGRCAPPHAHPGWRHELQGIQHRHPRVRPQRGADVLPARHRPLVPERRSQHRLHRGVRNAVPGAGHRAPGPDERQCGRRFAGPRRPMGDGRDRRRVAGRHEGVALAVRAPGCNSVPAPGSGAGVRA